MKCRLLRLAPIHGFRDSIHSIFEHDGSETAVIGMDDILSDRQSHTHPDGWTVDRDRDGALRSGRRAVGCPSGSLVSPSDTIVALSTGAGAGAIGIVRLSGPEAVPLGRAVFRAVKEADGLGSLGSHRLLYGHVVDPDSGSLVDEVLAVVMRAPGTYTREDVVEIHCHGGPAAQRAVLRLLVRLGARPADPGEFTRRAFLNGRIDLTQAESVAAIVAARSSSALRAAVRQLDGGLSERLRGLRAELIGALARVEVAIDFSDEDPGEVDRESILADVLRAESGLRDLLGTAFLGRLLEQGVRTAIVGRPNVGKSSLLNGLLRRERAIVSEIPGTTRDTVEELTEVAGVPLQLVDTAGLRESHDVIERLGIERSQAALREADLVLAVFDLSEPLRAEDFDLLALLDPERTILVGNKCDLTSGEEADEIVAALTEGLDGRTPPVAKGLGNGAPTRERVCRVSALTGEGLDEVRRLIEATVVGEGGLHLDDPLLATERQRALVAEAVEVVGAAASGLRSGLEEELVSEDLRAGIEALGRITGDELVPDLLDQIFSRFCIGK